MLSDSEQIAAPSVSRLSSGRPFVRPRKKKMSALKFETEDTHHPVSNNGLHIPWDWSGCYFLSSCIEHGFFLTERSHSMWRIATSLFGCGNNFLLILATVSVRGGGGVHDLCRCW